MTQLTATREEIVARLEASHLRRALDECPIPSPWLDEKEAAIYIDCSVRFLQNGRVSGTGPRYANYGKVVYHYRDLDAYVAAHRRHSTSDAPRACGYGCHGGERTVPVLGEMKVEDPDA